MKYFEAINLQKKYPKKTINFSMTAEKGSFTCLVGQSGCGKSTVLKIIAGILSNDNPEGKIFLNEKNITCLKPGKRGIGLVFQNRALFPHMNIIQNVTYGLKCHNMNTKEAYSLGSLMLEKFNLAGFEKRSVDSLSGGEAQRVALARSLIVNPELLLLDEPLSALDAELRNALGEDLKIYLKENNITTIMVTHDIEEAKKLSDQIIKLESN